MADCKNCNEKHRDLPNVPYIVHEKAMARNDRLIKRFIIAFLIVIALWFSTIGMFVLYLNLYDFESYEIDLSTDGGGDANFIGQDGDIYNGKGHSEATDAQQEGRR